jgi:hypothetical protein
MSCPALHYIGKVANSYGPPGERFHSAWSRITHAQPSWTPLEKQEGRAVTCKPQRTCPRGDVAILFLFVGFRA